jgi:hypothetical protein
MFLFSDAVVSYISAHMRKQGRLDTDLLVIDNPGMLLDLAEGIH